MASRFRLKHTAYGLLPLCLLLLLLHGRSASVLANEENANHGVKAADAMDWQAKWIWPAVADVPTHPNQFVQFRRVFTLAEVPAQARIAAFADSRYQLFINGNLVGRRPARGPVYWGYYDVFKVAKYLRPGKNVITAEVRWLDASMGWFREPPGAPDHGGFLCQLELGSGAARQVIATDTSWKAHEDASMRWGQPRINGALPEVEVTDGALEDPGWKQADYDDSRWSPVLITPGQSGQTDLPLDPFAHLARRPMGYPIEMEMAPAKIVDAGLTAVGPARSAIADNAVGNNITFEAATDLKQLGNFIAAEPHNSDLSILSDREALTQVGPNHLAVLSPSAEATNATSYIIFDMGKEVDGYPQMTMDAPAGTVIELAWSEVLTDGGHVAADHSGGNYVARYLTRKGMQTWSMWGWHGMRYLEVRISGNHAPVRLHAGLIFSTANLQRAGSFSSSDPLLNQLWQMGAYTFQLCTFDGTMDCPTREQREWVGDGEVELQVNDAVNDNPDVDRKFLLDAAREQRQDGAIPSVAASGESTTWVIDDYIFSFVDAAHWYYLQTGDRDLLDEIYPNIVRAMMWFQPFRQQDGMLGKLPYWTFLGWANPNKDGESSIMNALYVHALENAAEIADTEKDARTAQLFRSEAQQIRRGFNAKFWNGARGVYVDSWKDGKQSAQVSQLASADAVLYGFAPKQTVPSILKTITTRKNLKPQRFDTRTGDMIATDDFDPRLYIKQAQTYGTNYLLDALVANGDERAALDTIRANWGPMAPEGNETFWEHFSEIGGTSCHAWSASPTYVLSRSVLGVVPVAPGYTRYTVAPQVGDLTWAEGAIPTPKGTVRVSWRLLPGPHGRSSRFQMQLNAPFAADVRLVVPKVGGVPAASITLNGQSHTGEIHLSAAGVYQISARYP